MDSRKDSLLQTKNAKKTEHMRALDTLNPPCYPLSTPLEDNYLVGGGRGGGGFPSLTHSHSTQLSDSSRCQIMSSLNKSDARKYKSESVSEVQSFLLSHT